MTWTFPVYANSLLATLNIRTLIRKEGGSNVQASGDTGSIPLGNYNTSIFVSTFCHSFQSTTFATLTLWIRTPQAPFPSRSTQAESLRLTGSENRSVLRTLKIWVPGWICLELSNDDLIGFVSTRDWDRLLATIHRSLSSRMVQVGFDCIWIVHLRNDQTEIVTQPKKLRSQQGR